MGDDSFKEDKEAFDVLELEAKEFDKVGVIELSVTVFPRSQS